MQTNYIHAVLWDEPRGYQLRYASNQEDLALIFKYMGSRTYFYQDLTQINKSLLDKINNKQDDLAVACQGNAELIEHIRHNNPLQYHDFAKAS